MKKLLTTVLATTTMLFTNAPAPAQTPAQDWLYIGNNDGYEFYVDVNREIVNGSYWAAPALAIAPERTKMLGKFLIDCSDSTYKTQFANYTSDWSTIGAGSPLAYVAENVCH